MIDKKPGVAIIGEQSKTDPRKWALLGDDRSKYTKHVKECQKAFMIREESYIPNKKGKISLKKWNKLLDKILKMAK
jgi:hypothetical protein